MGRCLFFNIPAYGHVNPTLALCRELIDRGEKITYFNSPDFREVIEPAGPDFQSYDIEVEYDVKRLRGNMHYFALPLMSAAEKIIPKFLDEVKERNPDYVISDAFCPWGKLLGRRAGVPVIASIPTFALSPEVVFSSKDFAWRFVTNYFRNIGLLLKIIKRFGSLKKKYGFEGMTPIYNTADMNLVYTSRRFQPAGDSFDRSFRFVGPQLKDAGELEGLPVDLLKKSRVIYVSLGTVLNERVDFFKKCIQAFKDSDYTVVIYVGGRVDVASLGRIPENVIISRALNQVALLEHTDLFITHAGMNSAGEALCAGAPMLLAPQGSDQPLVARRVEEMGAGIRLDKCAGAVRIRKLAEKVLNDESYKKNSVRVGRTLKEAGGYKRAADEVMEFVKSKG